MSEYIYATTDYVDDAVAKSGGGSSDFVVNVTKCNEIIETDPLTYSISLDKTFEEIRTAALSRKNVVLYCSLDIIPLPDETGDRIDFTGMLRFCLGNYVAYAGDQALHFSTLGFLNGLIALYEDNECEMILKGSDLIN